ncbi:mitofilin family membrane protein [Kaistia defluvii]|uniref:COG4223 family protein n=1 Tax=Kaistia defluvii TaxID=410841 RepID=UPI0022563732|nr:mitofilin family membrane protein [Kaistia defluvii]MCX5518917.1 mitofilin family membrane protein [Kaistia defluvii]
MSDDDTFKPAGEPSGSRRKRPPVTIDLAAESSGATSPPSPEQTAPVSTPDPVIEPAPDAPVPPPAYEPEVGTPEPAAPVARESAPGRFVIPAIAALGGGVIGGLLVALLSSSTGTNPVNSASLDSRFAAVSARLDRVEAATTEAASRPAAAGGVDPARIAGLEKEIAALKSAASQPVATATAPSVDLGPIESRLSALETRPAPVAPEAAPAAPPVDLTPLQSRLDALTTRLDAVEAHPPADPKTEAAARVIAVTALRQAASGSGPFANELAAVSALGTEDTEIAALQPLAATGAPSKADLIAAFPAVADQIRIAAAKVDPGASLIDRLTASAGSLVSVKPSGPMAGPSATAVVSRMEAAVKDGNLAEALREGDGLDAIARAPLADWAAKAGQRIAIDTALAGLSAAKSSN